MSSHKVYDMVCFFLFVELAWNAIDNYEGIAKGDT